MINVQVESLSGGFRLSVVDDHGLYWADGLHGQDAITLALRQATFNPNATAPAWHETSALDQAWLRAHDGP